MVVVRPRYRVAVALLFSQAGDVVLTDLHLKAHCDVRDIHWNIWLEVCACVPTFFVFDCLGRCDHGRRSRRAEFIPVNVLYHAVN